MLILYEIQDKRLFINLVVPIRTLGLVLRYWSTLLCHLIHDITAAHCIELWSMFLFFGSISKTPGDDFILSSDCDYVFVQSVNTHA